MKRCLYYDEIGVRSANLLNKEFGTEKSTTSSTVTIKTVSPRPLPYTIPHVPIKLGGSYAATISNRDGSLTHQLTATTKLWDRVTGTTVLSNPKGKFALSSTVTAENLPFPGLTLACAPAPWGTAHFDAKYHHGTVGVFSSLKKNAGKPEYSNTFLVQLPKNLYFGLNIDLSLLKIRSPFGKPAAAAAAPFEDDVSDDDDDVTDDVSAEEKGVVGKCAACLSSVKKSVNKCDGIVGYVSPKMEVKGYISNFGKTVGCAIFRQINDVWSVAVNTRCNLAKKKLKNGLFVEGAAKYVINSGSAVKVKCNSDCVLRGSYAVKFSEAVSALFYGSVNREFSNNVGFSLVFNK